MAAPVGVEVVDRARPGATSSSVQTPSAAIGRADDDRCRGGRARASPTRLTSKRPCSTNRVHQHPRYVGALVGRTRPGRRRPGAIRRGTARRRGVGHDDVVGRRSASTSAGTRPVGERRDEVDVAVPVDPLAEGDAAAQVEPGDQAVGNGGRGTSYRPRRPGAGAPWRSGGQRHRAVDRPVVLVEGHRGRPRRPRARPRSRRPTTRRRPGRRSAGRRTPPAPARRHRGRRAAATTTDARWGSAERKVAGCSGRFTAHAPRCRRTGGGWS